LSSEVLSESEWAFARRAMRRRRLFLALSAAGLVVALGLSVYYTWRRIHDPQFAVGARIALVLLILLNARQNLRQYRYAGVLSKLAMLGCADESDCIPAPGTPVCDLEQPGA
jgi:uncharacterized membrane protein